MSKEIRNSIFNLPEGGSSDSSWTPQKIAATFEDYYPIVPGSYQVNDHILSTRLGSTAYLTVIDATPGAESFQCLNNATYKTADTDYIWFNYDASQRTVTTAELIGYDLQRTPVKYLDNSPNTISIIGILKTGVVVSGTLRDQIFTLFELPVLWDNSLNGYGHAKSNRIGQNLWLALGSELLINVGASGSTDLVDSNADGLANTFSELGQIGASVASIVTGNGFTARAQRVERTGSIGTNGFVISLTGHKNKLVRYSFEYRSSNPITVYTYVRFMGQKLNLPINTGNAITLTGTLTTGSSDDVLYIASQSMAVGGYYEIGNFSLKEQY